ncbi:4Fe-4S binding protein [bacterium]|nr:4Fe-4S binding protein [bacterium]MBU1650580.1 4Fe-4S binding protein [bacterium]MBU1882018.1 4Fe-4S binding protein [bacterium]
MKTRYLRYSILILILGIVTYQALGFSQHSFEAYCPFGGMEALWGLFRAGQFSCATGPLNLSMMVAVLGLAIVAKKTFCGWACPIGFLSELFSRLGSKIGLQKFEVGPKLNGALKLLRYVVLIVALFYTYKLGELVLRGFDPFYIIFSGFGHGTLGWITYTTLGVIAVGALLIPMFFCRYLCPLGATFDPFSRLGIIKIERNAELCTECGDCGSACLWAIKPMEMKKVRDRDCTNCLECVDACPVDDCLSLKASL